MSWELRGNRLYYYRKRRLHGRVCSEYWGRGEDAELIAEMDAGDPVGQQIANDVEQSQREDEEALVRSMDELEADIAALVMAQCAASGLWLHKGQWRRRRHET